jgi:hypothetical protein
MPATGCRKVGGKGKRVGVSTTDAAIEGRAAGN